MSLDHCPSAEGDEDWGGHTVHCPLNSSKLLGPRETLGLEGCAPLTSLLGGAVLVEAGRFQAEVEAVGEVWQWLGG